ncbi:sensor histidine kinase [Ornithinibacillus salinisoli]|uniref:histidine kinase n=1 Tax=Ornithinibacillus salinisoli TaxID=1848459 RepID=A0ABW4W6A6_9BACI
MSKEKNSPSGRELTKVIFTRMFISLVLFTVILGIVFLTATYIITRFTWYEGDFLYGILHQIDINKVPILLTCWVIGFILIFLLHWKKTLRYIDTVVEASNELVETNDNLIHLPVELKQVEDQMNQVKQEAIRNARFAKEAEQRKSDLIVYLAHDLKTPLTSVIGYLTLLRDEKEISEKLREKYLSISLEKAERLEDLINEFFEITRFNLSQLSLDQSRVNLTRMLEQITYEFQPMLATKNLECSLQMEPNIEIKCDVNKMERVFDNLIRNAINYSFENCTVKIVAEKKDDGVVVHFENRGNTISQEKQSRIFEQFYRLDVSRGTNTGGAGLGLAIAKEIVEKHQGSITVFSENETIRFTVFLPEAS